MFGEILNVFDIQRGTGKKDQMWMEVNVKWKKTNCIVKLFKETNQELVER